MRRSPYNKKMFQKGFTLVEMIVSVGLFTVVAFIATGSLLSTVLINKKSQAQQSVVSNLNFALESMTREIRVGTGYECLNSPCSTFSFTSQEGSLYRYELGGLDNQQIMKSTGGGAFIPVTASEIKIEDLSFDLSGETAGDQEQPRVFITVSGEAFVQSLRQTEKVDFAIQTLVTQRRIDR